MKVRQDQAQTLKRDLEDGLEKWRQQVLEVQENNIRRAEMQAEGKMTLRRQRSREERRGRERRVMERRRQSKEREEEELKVKQVAIEEKQKRVSDSTLQTADYKLTDVEVDSLLREREESIERQRRLAAKVRSDPER